LYGGVLPCATGLKSHSDSAGVMACQAEFGTDVLVA
jgi:hypothetical protein